MEREQTVSTILSTRLIAILRLHDAERVVELVEAIHGGGAPCIEITLNTPDALRAISTVRERLPEVVIGAGTVLGLPDARAALDAGARFLVTPVTIPEIVPLAHQNGAPVVMGALSPTEIHAADGAGADLIKLFPASTVGPEYLDALRGPLPGLRVVPTGGIGADNAGVWLEHGAVAVGVGGALTDRRLIEAGRFDEIVAHVRVLLDAVRRAS